MFVGLTACACLSSVDAARAQQPNQRGIVNTPPAYGERIQDTLRVGDAAPDFTLSDPQGKQKVTLSSFREKRPVILIFGSYT
jgi:hypothetical protein